MPDFSLQAASSTLYVNQAGKAFDTFTIDAINGFTGSVALSLSALPTGILGGFTPQVTTTTSQLTVAATALAPTTSGVSLMVSGTSGATTRTVPALSLAVSAAAGDCGLGTPVDLRSAFNLAAVRNDSSTFSDGGLDDGGYAYSANLLGPARVLNGIRYVFGLPNASDAVYAAGQTIALPTGRYNALQLLGTGIRGVQSGQILTITYTDGTTAQYTQSFSDWFSPSVNVNEGEAVAMAYRDRASGTQDTRQFNVYGYTLALDSSKTVKSLTLPRNRAVILLAATLSEQNFGREVNLARAYNATGIYTDGSTFDGAGGIDAGGAAYSANLLQDATGNDVVVGTSHFHLAAPNVPNTVYAAGQTIPLPPGFYQDLKLLGTGVQGSQTDQPIVVTYYDGSTVTYSQSFSDWSTLSGYSNESLAIRTAYRDYNDGFQDNQAFNVYLYTLPLQRFKPVKSITLPDNRNVVLLGITLALPSIFELEPLVCPVLNGGAPAANPQ